MNMVSFRGFYVLQNALGDLASKLRDIMYHIKKLTHSDNLLNSTLNKQNH